VKLYSLRNSAILDSGANIHVFNQLTRFQNYRTAPTGDYVATPDGEAPVLGYGEVDIEERRLERFEPKAWLGYLVGYNAASIYRIWVPKLGRVVSTRDVIFNEDEGFNGNLDDEDDDLFRRTVADLAALLVNIDARDVTITVHTDPLMTEESNAAELTEEASQALDSDGQGHHDLGTVNTDDAGTQIEDEIVAADRPEIEIPEITEPDPGPSSGPDQSGKPSQTRLGPVTRSQTEASKTGGHLGRF